MERLKLYLKESYNELVNKVTWPTWNNLQQTSVVVLITSGILALIIFFMDLASKGLINELIYKHFAS